MTSRPIATSDTFSRWLIPAFLVTTVAACSVISAQPKTTPYQGWNAQQQKAWYGATQGSRMMPLSWFRKLEQADNQNLFADPAHLAKFGILTAGVNDLPVGFVIDNNDDANLGATKLQWFNKQDGKQQWVGLNCAACHTTHMTYGGRPWRVDGGPSLFDFQSFNEALDNALLATKNDPAKFERFAEAVLGTRYPASTNYLRSAVDKLVKWQERVETLNRTPLRYGPGRVDAFGHIYNKVALFSGAPNPTPNPADAPVSYPFLWDIYRHDKLQWNGIATNARLPLGGSRYLDYGALGRNSGEVIGVFGDVVSQPGNSLGGYKSSLWTDNLIRLETQLSSLRAPAWPAQLFGAIDDTDAKRALIADGKALFTTRCSSCHAPHPGTAPYKVKMERLTFNNRNNTDPWMACNAISYRSATGNLKGTSKDYIGSNDPYGDEAPLADMLATTVKAAMLAKKGQIIKQTGRVFFGAGGAPRVVIEEVPDRRSLLLEACLRANSEYMAYKARPLDGIWATAPYLHNGSVPNLYELLLPQAQRSATFRMGSREYDPIRVGYSIRPDAAGNHFTFNTALPGNTNVGHDYGASSLTEAQRQALLQYLKTL